MVMPQCRRPVCRPKLACQVASSGSMSTASRADGLRQPHRNGQLGPRDCVEQVIGPRPPRLRRLSVDQLQTQPRLGEAIEARG
jgi:hypothetical protein